MRTSWATPSGWDGQSSESRDAPTVLPGTGKRCVLGPVGPGSGQRASQSTAPEPTGREEGDPSQGSTLFKTFKLLLDGVFRGRSGAGIGAG